MTTTLMVGQVIDNNTFTGDFEITKTNRKGRRTLFDSRVDGADLPFDLWFCDVKHVSVNDGITCIDIC